MAIKVLVNGMGTIGTGMTRLLLQHREMLGVGEVLVFKNQAWSWTRPEQEQLRALGAVMCADEGWNLAEAVSRVDYVFDCTADGMGMSNLPAYRSASLLGYSAQGSEQGFGPTYVLGINRPPERGGVHIASCNTHGILSVLRALSGGKPAQITHADLVLVRRSEDVGKHRRLVAGNVISNHREPEGTHHAAAVRKILQDIGVDIQIFSSAITGPSQFMHALRFSVTFKDPMETSDLLHRIAQDPLVASTLRYDADALFEYGRRYGLHGRIYAQSICVLSSLVLEGNTIKGWAFIPQEGNTLLSTLSAFLSQSAHPRKDAVVAALQAELVHENY